MKCSFFEGAEKTVASQKLQSMKLLMQRAE
jgi:hypothetical protein